MRVVKVGGQVAAREADGAVAAAAVAGTVLDESDGRAIIMDVTLAVTKRLSENQLQKAQEFILGWIKREQSILRGKLAHKRQFDILLRGTRGSIAGSSGATGGA